MTSLLELPHHLDRSALTCRAIVETPKGRQCKYDYDAESGLFLLAGMLPTGMSFPLAFGFIPSTLGEDGDPIDVLILAEEELPIGCLLSVRLLGVIVAKQTEAGNIVRNDRLIARAAHSRLFADIHEVKDLGPTFTEELGCFFTTYNALKGNRFEVQSIDDATLASKLIDEASQSSTVSK